MAEQTNKSAKRSKPRLNSSRSTQGSDSSHSRRPSSDTEYKGPGAQGSLLSVTSADSEQGPDGTFLDQAQHYPSLVGSFPPESDGGPILSAIMETTHQAERLKGGLPLPHIQTTGYLSSTPSATKLKARKSISAGRKSQNTVCSHLNYGSCYYSRISQSTLTQKNAFSILLRSVCRNIPLRDGRDDPEVCNNGQETPVKVGK